MNKALKIILILLFIFILVLATPFVLYLLWNKSFESNLSSMVCSSNTTEVVSLDDKFKDFVLSDESVTFVELSPMETVSLLKNTDIINGGEIQNLCVVPSDGVWGVYIKMSLQGINLPWFKIDIAKDDMETAQLYVKNIYVGKWELPDKIAANIKTQLNKGISDALVLVNENNFIGRKIQNIELLQDKIVVKGALN